MATSGSKADNNDAALARIRRLQGYLARDPANLLLMADLADAQLDASRVTEAGEVVRTALQLAPDDPVWRYRGAVVDRLSGRAGAAASALEALLAHGTRAPAVMLELVRALCEQGHWERAAEVAAQIPIDELPPATAASAGLLHVRILHRLNRLDQAIELAEQILQRGKEGETVAAALGTLYLDAGRTGDAARLLHAVEATRELDAEFHSVGGFVALESGDLDSAQRYFTHSLSQVPAFGRTHLGFGLVHAARGETEAARDSLIRATELMPEHLGTWLALAWMHLLAGDLTAAEEVLQRALAVNRNFADTHGGLAIVAALRGEGDRARDSIRVGRRLDPRSMNVAVAEILVQHGGRLDAPTFLREALGLFQQRVLAPSPSTQATFLRLVRQARPA